MPHDHKTITIVLADDDPDDRLMTRRAFKESRLANDLRCVEDGVELMEYLHQTGRYSDKAESPRPGLILLDLNMPRKDGREALAEIKGDATLKDIPIIILTTSKADEDIIRSYCLGTNSYITKPVTLNGLTDVVKAMGLYWLSIVELPNSPASRAA